MTDLLNEYSVNVNTSDMCYLYSFQPGIYLFQLPV